ncbi:hypothetical protein ACFQMA_09690 [Halosimplex aquaticum]|uniref:Uncharacterized protein n=1 Tax=Halosimplex aquaticum TaxID=3026162 RepID=A0ABD5Y2Y4_9EURY|nr:hypothetical protein [Halosimplex aquaticum]
MLAVIVSTFFVGTSGPLVALLAGFPLPASVYSVTTAATRRRRAPPTDR